MSKQAVVLIEELATQDGKHIGIATLNAEKSLNSLSVEMVEILTPALLKWQADTNIVCVVLQAAGEKAFCAGGDIRKLYDSMIECGADKTNDYAEAFFANEYRLDHLIHTYKKPLICWGHGIVMGGGIGLLSGAQVRVVTETSRLAMPEISIGLFPDVGSTYFLNKTPGRTGLYLGLTGTNMNAADALFIGLADRFIKHEFKAKIFESLCKASWSVPESQLHSVVNKVLRTFENKSKPELPDSQVKNHFDLINELCDADNCTETVEKILSFKTEDPWLQKGIDTLAKGCPTTAHIVYEQFQRGKHLSLAGVFQMELIIALQCSKHPDFPEGVRALLVDKDGKPQWQHESVATVPQAYIEQHFTAPWSRKQASNPLKDLTDY